MAQIAAPVATAHEIDGGRRLLQFHFEGGHEGIFGHHGYAVSHACDLDANGEFIIGHGGVFLVAAIPRRTVTIRTAPFRRRRPMLT
jgi:hypothetical protein